MKTCRNGVKGAVSRFGILRESRNETSLPKKELSDPALLYLNCTRKQISSKNTRYYRGVLTAPQIVRESLKHSQKFKISVFI